ncbi:hypothetical protein B0O99DRAFT_688155 [Bisporella sp. PMI_857]|nr:hypothetical protein B0O99DRAFT_688155 [Bisporella sp. PMI_857]
MEQRVMQELKGLPIEGAESRIRSVPERCCYGRTNIDVFMKRKLNYGETIVFAMVGRYSNNGLGLFFAETVFGGIREVILEKLRSLKLVIGDVAKDYLSHEKMRKCNMKNEAKNEGMKSPVSEKEKPVRIEVPPSACRGAMRRKEGERNEMGTGRRKERDAEKGEKKEMGLKKGFGRRDRMFSKVV